MRIALLSLTLGLVAASSQGAVVINELFYAPGNVANEFIELQSSTPNQSLSGYSLIAIGADNPEDSPGYGGRLKKVFSLDNFTTGSNGLFLLRNTTNNPLFPDADPATTMGTVNFAAKPAGDVSLGNNDLPNGATLWLLVSGFDASNLPTNTQFGFKTLDLDQDGTLDSTPWTQVHYGFLYFDYAFGLASYADGLSFNVNGIDIDVPVLGAGTEYEEEGGGAVIRTPDYPANDGLINVTVSGSTGGPYLVGTDFSYPLDPEYFPDHDYYLSPGSVNERLAIPEPATAALLVMGLAGLATMRRRS